MKSSLHLLHGKTHQRIVNWQVGQLLVIQVAFLWRDVIRSTVRADLRCHWGFLQLLKDSPFSLSFLLEWSSMHAYERDSDLYGRFPKSWFSDIKKKKKPTIWPLSTKKITSSFVLFLLPPALFFLLWSLFLFAVPHVDLWIVFTTQLLSKRPFPQSEKSKRITMFEFLLLRLSLYARVCLPACMRACEFGHTCIHICVYQYIHTVSCAITLAV